MHYYVFRVSRSKFGAIILIKLKILSLRLAIKNRVIVGVASFPGSPKARAEKKKRRAWYQPCMHAHVLLRFWVNHILSVHPASPKCHHS